MHRRERPLMPQSRPSPKFSMTIRSLQTLMRSLPAAFILLILGPPLSSLIVFSIIASSYSQLCTAFSIDANSAQKLQAAIAAAKTFIESMNGEAQDSDADPVAEFYAHIAEITARAIELYRKIGETSLWSLSRKDVSVVEQPATLQEKARRLQQLCASLIALFAALTEQFSATNDQASETEQLAQWSDAVFLQVSQASTTLQAALALFTPIFKALLLSQFQPQ
eukprot:m.770446 g.770446  ORF g.770446 m.770446 type:complete len:223 (+) comp59081_c1_seq23:689-1357(+)